MNIFNKLINIYFILFYFIYFKQKTKFISISSPIYFCLCIMCRTNTCFALAHSLLQSYTNQDDIQDKKDTLDNLYNLQDHF